LKEQKRIERQERANQATGGFRAGQGKSLFSPLTKLIMDAPDFLFFPYGLRTFAHFILE